MCFQSEEIHLARELRDLGLSWEPCAGQYIWDEAGVIDDPSPIQENVHVIHDVRGILRQAGSMNQLKKAMCWLPTWREARQLLRSMGLSDLKVPSGVSEERRPGTRFRTASPVSTDRRTAPTGEELRFHEWPIHCSRDLPDSGIHVGRSRCACWRELVICPLSPSSLHLAPRERPFRSPSDNQSWL